MSLPSSPINVGGDCISGRNGDLIEREQQYINITYFGKYNGVYPCGINVIAWGVTSPNTKLNTNPIHNII